MNGFYDVIIMKPHIVLNVRSDCKELAEEFKMRPLCLCPETCGKGDALMLHWNFSNAYYPGSYLSESIHIWYLGGCSISTDPWVYGGGAMGQHLGHLCNRVGNHSFTLQIP